MGDRCRAYTSAINYVVYARHLLISNLTSVKRTKCSLRGETQFDLQKTFAVYMSGVCDSGQKPPIHHQAKSHKAAILATGWSIYLFLSVVEVITSTYCGSHTSGFANILLHIFQSVKLFSGPRLSFPMSKSLFLKATIQFIIRCLISRLAVRYYGHMSIPAEKEEEIARKFDNGTWD